MNTLIEYEASKLVDLFGKADNLAMHLFMDNMSMPVDVQDRLISEISALSQINQQSVGEIIEHHGQSLMSERLRW